MLSLKWLKVSYFFLFSVACIGTLLRSIAYVPLPFNYQSLVHAHSHVAFQGWVYTVLFLLLVNLFLTEETIKKKRYNLQFVITLVVVSGILVSFSLQGYAFFSILFSSLFQVLNYWFIYSFFKDTKALKPTIALRFIKTGLLLGVLSTIAPWGIGFLSAKGLNNTEMFNATVYFFLHFQYNGWFLFVLFGLLFKLFEKYNIVYNEVYAARFFIYFRVAFVPAYTLSLLGMSFRDAVFFPALFAGVTQVLGLFYFIKLIKEIWESKIGVVNSWSKLFLTVAFASFILKIGLQLVSVIPELENYAFGSKNLVLAYLHLSLIGFTSFMLIAMLIQLKWLVINKLTITGSLLLVSGYLGSELLLAVTGFGWGYYPILLISFSAFMALGFFSYLISSSKQ